MDDCKIELWEQPARKVKFRMEVHGHRCQNKELLVGRNSTEDGRIFPLVKLICGSQGGRIRESLRRDLFVRMSLVDIRSSNARIIEHYHQLVDCNNSCQTKGRSITKKLTGMDDRVEFDNLGIVKTLEKDKEDEVTERMVLRREEAGENLGTWDRQDIRDKATRQAKETSAFRLKLMFEAFLYDERGVVVKVAPDVFSDEIVDLTNTTTGEMAVRKMNLAHDTCTGGAEIMMFTGGGKPECKVNHARAIFQAEFFQLDPQDPLEERKVWSSVVDVREDDLHTVGQFLGGLSFQVPPYRDPNIAVATQNVYCQIIKRNATKKDQIQSRSDPLKFTYTPQAGNLQRTILKRPMPNILQAYQTLHGSTPQNIPFVPLFNPDIPSKFPKLGDLLPSVVTNPPQLQQRAPSVNIQPPLQFQQRAQTLNTNPSPQLQHRVPSVNIHPPSQPQQISPNLTIQQPQLGAPSHTFQQPSPTQLRKSTSLQDTINEIQRQSQDTKPILSPSYIPDSPFSPSQMGAMSLSSPNPPPYSNIPSPSPSGGTCSINPSAQPPMYMSTSPAISINPPSNSFTMLVDPQGLGNASSTPANSPMDSLWQHDSNAITLNLGPDLGSIYFGDLLNDAPHHLSGIQPDSESFEDMRFEIIATDGETKENIPENNTKTTEIKEKQIKPKNTDKLKDKSNKKEKSDSDEKQEYNITVIKVEDQKENDLSESIGNLKLN